MRNSGDRKPTGRVGGRGPRDEEVRARGGWPGEGANGVTPHHVAGVDDMHTVLTTCLGPHRGPWARMGFLTVLQEHWVGLKSLRHKAS